MGLATQTSLGMQGTFRVLDLRLHHTWWPPTGAHDTSDHTLPAHSPVWRGLPAGPSCPRFRAEFRNVQVISSRTRDWRPAACADCGLRLDRAGDRGLSMMMTGLWLLAVWYVQRTPASPGILIREQELDTPLCGCGVARQAKAPPPGGIGSACAVCLIARGPPGYHMASGSGCGTGHHGPRGGWVQVCTSRSLSASTLSRRALLPRPPAGTPCWHL